MIISVAVNYRSSYKDLIKLDGVFGKTRTWLLEDHLMYSELITWATRPNAILTPQAKGTVDWEKI